MMMLSIIAGFYVGFGYTTCLQVRIESHGAGPTWEVHGGCPREACPCISCDGGKVGEASAGPPHDARRCTRPTLGCPQIGGLMDQAPSNKEHKEEVGRTA